jgi:hypothetical protein
VRIAGRRASYLPPFRLYIVVSLLFFLVVSLTAQVSTHTAISSSTARKARSENLADIQREFDASTDPEERALLGSQLKRLNTLNDKLGPAAQAASCSELLHEASGPTWLQRGLITACEKTKADHGKALQRNLIHNLGRAMFLFLPLLAALMKLLYLRQKRYCLPEVCKNECETLEYAERLPCTRILTQPDRLSGDLSAV